MSPTDYYRGNKVIGKLSDTNEFRVLSFSIENSADEAFLLNPNKSLAGQIVVRLALQNKNSKDILYFEDVLKNVSFNEIKNNSKTVNQIESQEQKQKLIEELSMIDEWFIPFLPKLETQNIQKNTKEPKEKFKKNDTDISVMAPADDDPLPPGVPRSVFTTLGTDSSDTFYNGWYKETNEWPAGSGNYLTYFIRWDINDYHPGSYDNDAYLRLAITHNNQYHWNSSTDTVTLFDTFNPMRIENMDLRMYIKEANDDFIYQRRFLGASSDSNFNYLKAFLALIPYAKDALGAYDQFTADSPSEQTVNGDWRVWASTRAEQELDLGGKVVRNIGGQTDSGRYIQNENEYVHLAGKVQDEGYAAKKIFYYMTHNVYGRNGWGFYTENLFSASQNYYYSYTR